MAFVKFRLKKIGETRNYFSEEIKNNDLMSKKPKNPFTYLNYVENLLILASVGFACVSLFAFTSLASVSVGTASSAVGLKTWQSMQESKSISQFLRIRIKITIK